MISEKLSLHFEGLTIELKKTEVSEIDAYFDDFSIEEIKFDRTYISKDEKLYLTYYDKDEDGRVDGIGVYDESIKTWNDLYVGISYTDFRQKCDCKEILIDPDSGDYILCIYSKADSDIVLGFYFSGDFEIDDPDISQDELLVMLDDNARIEQISIWNPK